MDEGSFILWLYVLCWPIMVAKWLGCNTKAILIIYKGTLIFKDYNNLNSIF